uniref:F-box domain-containing protein n=1 Tax=Caenorhabditis tropicalis TaxID=1561998 RepID=A0A1I7UW37_9PELO
MQTFKVLNLPLLALIEVWRCLNPIELFKISRCSKRCFKTVILSGTRKFELKLDIPSYAVSINNKWTFIVEDHDFMSINAMRGNMISGINGLPTFIGPPETIRFFSKNQYNDLLAVFFTLTDLFKCPTYSVIACRDTPNDTAMKYICSRQKTIANLEITTKTDKDLDVVLKNLKVTEHLYVGTDELPLNCRPPCQISCKSVKMYYSFHITVDDILNMKECVEIQIHGSSLTDQDIEVLFQHWNSGGFPKLEYLYISGKKLTEDMKNGYLRTLWRSSGWSASKRVLGNVRSVRNAVRLENEDGIVGMFRFENAYLRCPSSIRFLV